MSIVTLIGRLGVKETRAATARALAKALGAEDLVLFLRDPELGVWLPAPGFARTIRRGADWRAFLARCVAEGDCTGEMPSPSRDANVPAWAYRLEDGILVLLGGAPYSGAVASMLPLLPLVSAIALREAEVGKLTASAQLAATAAAQGDVLARALEKSRDDLRSALATAREAQRVMEEQAEELAASGEELEQAQEELQVINEELTETNAALEQRSADAAQALMAAEEANRAKSGFLAMMSHELRTPLNAIGGYAALLEEGVMGPLVDGQLEYVARIKRSQAHLLALINDVLNFAKTESGTLEYHIETLALRPLLANAASLIEPMAHARGVTYVYTPPEADLKALGDRDKLVQVVLNLLTNALKFTPEKGHVELFTESTPDAVLICVADSGPGIPADRLASIFEPFVQLERSFAQSREGIGLGLSISRELAAGMGGGIGVRSEPGKGSTFRFSLRHADVALVGDGEPVDTRGRQKAIGARV